MLVCGNDLIPFTCKDLEKFELWSKEGFFEKIKKNRNGEKTEGGGKNRDYISRNGAIISSIS